MVPSLQKHVAGITIQFKVTRVESKPLPKDAALGVVQIEFGDNGGLDGMEGIEFGCVQHTGGEVGIAENVEEWSLRNAENGGVCCGRGDTVGKVQDGHVFKSRWELLTSLSKRTVLDLFNTVQFVVRVVASTGLDETVHHDLDKCRKASLFAIGIDNVELLAGHLGFIVTVHGNVEVFGNESVNGGSEPWPLVPRKKKRM